MEQLIVRFAREKRNGQRVVFTNGCFDLLHPGHLASLEAARALGDFLIVGINSDESVRTLKGPGRPAIPEQERAEILEAIFDLSGEEINKRVAAGTLNKAALAAHDYVYDVFPAMEEEPRPKARGNRI